MAKVIDLSGKRHEILLSKLRDKLTSIGLDLTQDWLDLLLQDMENCAGDEKKLARLGTGFHVFVDPQVKVSDEQRKQVVDFARDLFPPPKFEGGEMASIHTLPKKR